MYLENINFPSDIKSLSHKELKVLCREIRDYMIECCAKNPGHLGASLGAVEITVALHYLYDTPEDRIVWDVGHQTYAHKILTGRKEAFKTNRSYHGISGFPKIAESKYDAFGVGHASTSISAALGIADAMKIQNQHHKVIAVIGDGSMSGGLAFEGLNNAGSTDTDILVILNDNHISIDHDTGALQKYFLKISTSHTYNSLKKNIWNRSSALVRGFLNRFATSTKTAIFKQGSLFEALGFRYFGTIDGNNLDELIRTLTALKDIKGPKLLHVVTKKGKGYKPAEEEQTIWHAPGTFNATTGVRTSKPKENCTKFQDVFGETLLELAKANDKIVGITPAMATGSSMTYLMKEIPERFFDVGIAEGHAVTFSAGLNAQGMLPVCNIYSSFAQRAYDNIIHDVVLQNLKVIFCFDRAGLVGEDGATHHGVFDMAAFRPIPNITIVSPLNEKELRNMLYSATQIQYNTTIIRYPRGYGNGTKWRGEKFSLIEKGKAELISNGQGISVLSIGPVGNVVQKAINAIISSDKSITHNQENPQNLKNPQNSKKTSEENISILQYNMRFLKPIDEEALKYSCKKSHTIITVEDGSIIGGLHSAVAEYIADNNLNNKLIGLGIPDRFIEQGNLNDLYKDCNIDYESIYKTILSAIKRQ
ncbi:MAG: 1-deoxy-D-xylulose-5-phosphate synthase [Bacteroidales bacterium]